MLVSTRRAEVQSVACHRSKEQLKFAARLDIGLEVGERLWARAHVHFFCHLGVGGEAAKHPHHLVGSFSLGPSSLHEIDAEFLQIKPAFKCDEPFHCEQ